jgi:predicted RNA-binding protein with PUA-like domain
MTYWLVKTDPDTYSIENLINDKKTIWDGVRNYQARNFLKLMNNGDLVLIYHSGEDKAIVGLAKVSKEFFQDPTTDDNNWVAVELTFKEKFRKFLTLEEIKKIAELKNIALLKQSRLSVMPITKDEFDTIINLTN